MSRLGLDADIRKRDDRVASTKIACSLDPNEEGHTWRGA